MFVVSFAEVLGADFLVVDCLRGLLTALCCTLVTFGAVLCNGALRVGILPNRAERLSVMMESTSGVSVQSNLYTLLVLCRRNPLADMRGWRWTRSACQASAEVYIRLERHFEEDISSITLDFA